MTGARRLALLVFAATFICGASTPLRMAVAADADAASKALFTTQAVPPCALCHTLKDAGATGAIGPVLDELQPDAERVATALRNGIGAMPSYKATLTEAQIVQLSRYVAKASGGAR